MDIKEMSQMVSEKTGMPEYKVRKVIVATFTVIRQQLLKAQVIRIKNLLSMYIDIRQPKAYFNVNRNEMVTKPRHFYLKIIPSKVLKKEIGEKKTY